MVTASQARAVVASVLDPELPVLTLDDLGILRDISVDALGVVTVTVTPTYSGCPAMEEIRQDITAALAAHGWTDVTVRTVLSPAWTTDWMSENGRRRLLEEGIAPPSARRGGPVPVQLGPTPVRCPRCDATDTEELSRFGATACKALWRCRVCREPFDRFKDH